MPFKFLQASDLEVVKIATDGTRTLLGYPADYSVTGAGVNTGGSLTLTASLPSGQKLAIRRNAPLAQNASYLANDTFPAATHEAALDALATQTQQIDEKASRALARPLGAATFDAAGQAITGLIASDDPTSAVTKAQLDAVGGGGGGGGGGSVAWANITGKPALEPAIAGGTTAQYWRGDKSWQTLDKTAVGLGAVDNTADLNKPVSNATQSALNGKQAAAPNLTALAGLSGAADLIGYFTGAAAMAVTAFTAVGRSLVGAASAAAALALVTPLSAKGDIFTFSSVSARLAVGTDGQILTADSSQATGLKWVTPASSGSIMPSFVGVYGGVGDGTTNNNTAFTNAEASAYERIWLPEGTYLTTLSLSSLSKRYEGPGKIKIGGSYYGGFGAASSISFGATTTEYGQGGSSPLTSMEYRVIRAGARQQLSATPNSQYFLAGATAHFAEFVNNGGASGTSSVLAATASAGASTAQLVGVDGLSVGDVVGFTLDDGGTISDTVTITNINTGTKVITFTPTLSNTYTVYGSDYVPTYLSGYAHAPRVTKGLRTMNPHKLAILTHAGEGDAYIWCGRVIVSYAPKSGQTDFFWTATGGLVGGDITLTTDGVYATGWECAYSDNSPDGGVTPGKDVAVIGFVNNYVRTNETGARRVTWGHDLAISKGTKAIDFFYLVSGKARVGMDLTQGVFTNQAAVQLKDQQRIYFNAVATNNPGDRARGYYAQSPGNSWIAHQPTDGTSEYMEHEVGGTLAMKLRPSKVEFSSAGFFGGRLDVNTDLGVGGNMSANGSITAGGTVKGQFLSTVQYAGTGQHLIYFGDQGSGPTYIVADTVGGHFAIYVNNVQKAFW